MKYYRAKLYADLNSRDLDVADAADARWEQAEQEYENRLREIRPRLSPEARTLADELSLHDAELVQHWNQDGQLFLWVGSTRQGHVLRYHLVQAPKLSAPRRSLPFSLQMARWLYDEIDLTEDGVFTHQILFSDGRELRVVFDKCLILETRAVENGTHSPSTTKPVSKTRRSPKHSPRSPKGKSSAVKTPAKASPKGSLKRATATVKSKAGGSRVSRF